MTEPKTKDHPTSERPPAPVRTPKDSDRVGSTDEGDRASRRGEKEFDPNVNQRPPR